MYMFLWKLVSKFSNVSATIGLQERKHYSKYSIFKATKTWDWCCVFGAWCQPREIYSTGCKTNTKHNDSTQQNALEVIILPSNEIYHPSLRSEVNFVSLFTSSTSNDKSEYSITSTVPQTRHYKHQVSTCCHPFGEPSLTVQQKAVYCFPWESAHWIPWATLGIQQTTKQAYIGAKGRVLYTKSWASCTSSCHPINTAAAKGQPKEWSNHASNLCLAEWAYCIYLEPFIDTLHMKQMVARKLAELIVISVLGKADAAHLHDY